MLLLGVGTGCGIPSTPRAEEERDNLELSLAGIALSSWSLRAPGSG